ncbi:MAG: hypothetical protein LBI87_01215 [Candidatus Accumulibacter sp.]|jgi:hypothetical protein|nr:hypothetical protein [Accumulibacter sp.]
MTPTQTVLQYYQLPFDLYPFQERTIDTLAPLVRAGYYPDMGLGKTVMSTVSALYKTLMGEARRNPHHRPADPAHGLETVPGAGA